MSKDLTTSAIERQNILNNPYAVTEVQKAIGLRGVEYRGKAVLFKEQVAEFFEVTPRTIDNYLSANESELRANGYEVLRGKALQELKLALKAQFGNEIDFATKTTILGVFDFRAFLDLAMLIATYKTTTTTRRLKPRSRTCSSVSTSSIVFRTATRESPFR